MEHITLIVKLDLKVQYQFSLCDCSDAYILVKGTITVLKTAGAGTAANNANKKVIFKSSFMRHLLAA